VFYDSFAMSDYGGGPADGQVAIQK